MQSIATPRKTQWSGLLSPASRSSDKTKFVDRPVVDRAPARDDVLYRGEEYMSGRVVTVALETGSNQITGIGV